MNRILLFLVLLVLVTIVSCSDSHTKKTYYPSGEIKVIYTVDDNMKKDGIQKEFWENGNLKEIFEWKHGIADGTNKKYYESGKISIIGRFTNGLQDSATTEYFESGQVHTVCFFKEGKRNGKFLSYFNNGSTEMIADIKNDTTIRSIRFDSVSNKVISFNVVPEQTDIPDSLSKNDNYEMSVTIGTSYIKDVIVSVKFYNSQDDYFNGKPFAYDVPALQNQNRFTFHLPNGIKEGVYFVQVKTGAINGATDHENIAFFKRINVLK